MPVGDGGWFLPSGLEWAAPAAAYLLGSIPFGLVLVHMAKGVDLRKFGSGNIGASNAMRAAGKPVGYAVFALGFWRFAKELAAKAAYPPVDQA